MKKLTTTLRKIVKAPVLVLIEVSSKLMHFKMYDRWLVPHKFDTLFGLYERETTRFLQKHVTKGMTVVDLGANVGYYTRLFSKLVGPQGQVYAFEPDPEAYAFLTYNTERLSNVKIFPYAVSDKDGEATFYHIPNATQSHTLIKTEHAEAYTVQTVSMDSFIQEPIDVIKIDTEGAEDQVFRGMKRHLLSPLWAVFEYTQGDTEPLVDELKKTGDIYSITEQGDLHPFSETQFHAGGWNGKKYANIAYHGSKKDTQ